MFFRAPKIAARPSEMVFGRRPPLCFGAYFSRMDFADVAAAPQNRPRMQGKAENQQPAGQVLHCEGGRQRKAAQPNDGQICGV
jgi:hypothetical protein